MDFENGLEDGYFPTEHGRMHYKHNAGSGNTLIFLHGFAASVKSWTRLVEYLPDSLDFYLIDFLGHGESDVPEIEYSMQMHYNTIVAFVKAKVNGTPAIFGHSYGGWLAAYYASKNKLSGLVLEDCAGLRDFVEDRHQNNPGYRETMIKEALKLNPNEHVLKSMLGSDNSKTELDDRVLAKINCKCMIIWGRDDKTVDPKYSAQFLSGIKGSKLEMIDARHTPHYTNAEQVSKLLLDFI